MCVKYQDYNAHLQVNLLFRLLYTLLDDIHILLIDRILIKHTIIIFHFQNQTVSDSVRSLQLLLLLIVLIDFVAVKIPVNTSMQRKYFVTTSLSSEEAWPRRIKLRRCSILIATTKP